MSVENGYKFEMLRLEVIVTKMFFRRLIIVGLFALIAGDDESVPDEERLYGGNSATISNYPYQCSLQFKNVHKCGASIISHSLVLTSRQCFPASPVLPVPLLWKLRCGSATTNTGGTTYKILAIFPHPNYTASTKEFDVAVIKLATPIKLSSTQAIITPTVVEPPAGTPVKIAGWGATTSGGAPSTSLQVITGSVYATKKCNSDYGADLYGSMMCTTSTSMNTCPIEGDRGSAVQVTLLGKTTQVGIVSWNSGCGVTTKADVNTNLGNPYISAFIYALINQFP